MSDVVRARRNINLAHPVTKQPVRVMKDEVVPPELWPGIGSLNLVDGPLPHLVEEGADVEVLEMLGYPEKATMEEILEWVIATAPGSTEVEGFRVRLARATHALEQEKKGRKRRTLIGQLEEMTKALSEVLDSDGDGQAQEVAE